MMWGAKVKTPVDMPDDILKDVIDIATKELSKCENFDSSGKSIDDILNESAVERNGTSSHHFSYMANT